MREAHRSTIFDHVSLFLAAICSLCSLSATSSIILLSSFHRPTTPHVALEKQTEIPAFRLCISLFTVLTGEAYNHLCAHLENFLKELVISNRSTYMVSNALILSPLCTNTSVPGILVSGPRITLPMPRSKYELSFRFHVELNTSSWLLSSLSSMSMLQPSISSVCFSSTAELEDLSPLRLCGLPN